jgi:hypothetical protein
LSSPPITTPGDYGPDGVELLTTQSRCAVDQLLRRLMGLLAELGEQAPSLLLARPIGTITVYPASSGAA